jgi:hypothetical protein
VALLQGAVELEQRALHGVRLLAREFIERPTLQLLEREALLRRRNMRTFWDEQCGFE